MVPGISAMLASVCLAADTDSDGLDDAVETNTGVFVSASNTGTNPNAADTDGDGVPDGLEVRAAQIFFCKILQGFQLRQVAVVFGFC
jgi:hypothetical protein